MFIYFHFKKGFIFCLLIIIFHLFSRIIEKSKLIIEDNYTILRIVSQISVIFVFIIEKQYTKQFIKKTESPNYDNFKKYLFPQDKIISLIIFSIVFDFFAHFLIIKKSLEFFEYYSNILIVFLFEMILFQKEIFSHHYISLVIYLFIIIFFQFTFYTNFIHFILLLLKFFVNGYCFYFSLFLIKYLNTNYFFSVYLLGSFIGIERLLFQIFIIKIDFSKIYNFTNNNIFSINIIYIILRFFYYYLYYTIISKLEPIYLYINDTIVLLLLQFILDENNKYKIQNINLIIITIITIISCFIFIEVIELNFCGLNKNTKQNITKRSQDNYLSMIKDISMHESKDSSSSEN